jgi:uncharacterized protein YdhG (YjbR/CyaY superfamily)
MGARVDPAVADYINSSPPQHRPLFQRIHALIRDECPEADVVLSYGMPTYKLGDRRLYLAVWKHGVSLYGWKRGGDAGFTARHPELRTSSGTIRLRTEAADAISDQEFRDLVRTALALDRGSPSRDT